MTNEALFQLQMTNDKYYTPEDLRMNRKYNFLLSSKNLEEYLNYKENITDDSVISLSLFSFNSNKLYYTLNSELNYALKDYSIYFKEDRDILDYKNIEKSMSEIMLGIIYSELEGTLKIEEVNTTRRQIESIIKTGNIKDDNDRIK